MFILLLPFLFYFAGPVVGGGSCGVVANRGGRDGRSGGADSGGRIGGSGGCCGVGGDGLLFMIDDGSH